MTKANEFDKQKINFSLARPFRARHNYTCTLCSGRILRGQFYFRSDPHPMARYFREKLPTYICVDCASKGGADLELLESKIADQASNHPRKPRSIPSNSPYEQLTIVFEEKHTRSVQIANITPHLLHLLQVNPNEIYNLSPNLFEELICDRLSHMGYNIERVGGHVYRKDGGIDIIAYKTNTAFPFFMAVQAKHHRSPTIKTGPDVVRELHSVIQTYQFNAGAIITNTTFTPDAQFFAKHHHRLLRLKDFQDIQRWLQDKYVLNEYDLREMPYEIEVCPGVVIRIESPNYK